MTTRGSLHGASPTARLGGVLLGAFSALMAMSIVMGEETLRPTREQIDQAMLERQLWLHNDIGITDDVPPPWTPVRVHIRSRRDAEIEMLGRRYRFNESLFPSSIQAWQQELLATPIALVVETDQPRHAVARSASLGDKKPGSVELVATGSLPGLHVVARHRFEYDGMLWTRLTLTPSGVPLSVRRLSLEVPLRRDAATYLNHHFFASATGNFAGMMGKMPDLPYDTQFDPCLWFGNEDVGLCWFAESDEGWDRCAPLTNQIEIADRRGARVLRLNFIRSPKEISGSLEFSFGMLATPPKPVKPDWRTNPALFTAGFSDWSWDKGGYYPEPDPAKVASGKFAAALGDPTGYFKTSFCYFGVKSYDGKWIAPEGYLFNREWQMLSVGEQELVRKPQPADIRIATLRGHPLSTMTDWLLWKWENLVRKHGMKNIYFDSLGSPNINPIHGAGYVAEDGSRQPTYDILAMREALKRFYVMLSKNLDDFNIMLHGGSSVPPVLSFAHAHLSGEQFIIDPRRVDDHYTEIMPLEEWRGFFYGRQFGVVGVFLPELQERFRKYRAPTEEMMMLVALHDVVAIKAFCYSGIIHEVQNALSEFGMQNMEFIPYWRSAAVVPSSEEEVKVSLYRDVVGHRAVLVLGNVGRTAHESTVELRNLFPSNHAVAANDLLHGEVLPIEQGKLQVAVRPLNFRLIAVTEK